MTAPKHTPTPWVQRGEQVNANRVHPVAPREWNEESVFGLVRSPVERTANAAFIVRAVNAHEALVAALRACRALGTLGETYTTHDAHALADAALALAGEE